MHLHLGNKWTKYDCFFNNKTPKDLKNHFHACIVKTVRRIVKNKYDCNNIYLLKALFLLLYEIDELKDIIRNFYCFHYIALLFKKDKQLHSTKITKTTTNIVNSKTKFTTKNLIRNKQLSLNIIDAYKDSYYNSLLRIKPNMLSIFNDVGYKGDTFISINPQLMRWFFYITIKSRLLKQSIKVIQDGSIKDIESLGALCNFVNDNYYLKDISDSLFNE
jgi:hypothetical protein